MKAVKITEENRQYLATRFELDEEYVDDLMGFNVVCDFGDDIDYSFLSDAALDKLFVRVETDKYPLQNGFFAIERK